MDNDVILSKIESLRKCVARLETKRPENAEKLKSDVDLQDIISINLERAVQTSVDIAAHIISDYNVSPPATMAESFSVLGGLGIIDKNLTSRLRKAVGFRNIAVHAYEKIDWGIVYAIITGHLDDFRKFTAAILNIMDT